MDFVIQRLESELKNRGIKKENDTNNFLTNNYFENQKEKSKIINGGTSININNIFDKKMIQMKKQMENDFYQYMLQFKSEVKNTLDTINAKMFNIEQHLLKINIINDNYRDTNARLAKLENNYNLFYKEFLTTNSICIENKKNEDEIKVIINEQSEEKNKLANELKINMKNILNRQTFLETKINENININIDYEKKIRDKINDLYKTKEDNINILSNNLISKINEYSNQTDNKFESLNNYISEIKNRIDNADNNINLLNDIPNLQLLSSNMNNQVNEIKTKIGEISKFRDDLSEQKREINNLKNDIQTLNSNADNINKLNNENKNINNDLEEMKKNVKFIEKKLNILDNNFNVLDNDINENKNEIRQIKKEIGNKVDNNIIKKEEIKKNKNLVQNVNK